jgi:hypothetical protein
MDRPLDDFQLGASSQSSLVSRLVHLATTAIKVTCLEQLTVFDWSFSDNEAWVVREPPAILNISGCGLLLDVIKVARVFLVCRLGATRTIAFHHDVYW